MAEREKRNDSEVQVLIYAEQSSLITARNGREEARCSVSEHCDF